MAYGKGGGGAHKGGAVGIRYTSGDKAPSTAHGTQPATVKSPTTRGPMAGKKKGY